VGLGTQLAFNTTYHPQIDGQTEKGEQSVGRHVKDACHASTQKWEEYLPLVEFSYNNGYQESLKMSPI
jgi:hypothetical protein